MKKVFLGGTVEGWNWRNDFIKMVNGKFECFDPVVSDWNEEARKREEQYKSNSDFNLYVITPYIKGVVSIYEVVEDSFIRPEKTIFAISSKKGTKVFDRMMGNSLFDIKMRLESKIKCFNGRPENCFPRIIDYIEPLK